jgi:cytochrome c553
MKNVLILIFVLAAGAVLISCSKARRNTGRAYMPDMAYSRAHETYAAFDSTKFTHSLEDLGEGKAYFNPLPVSGTVARGDMANYPYQNDSSGYNNSKNIKNPLPALHAKDYLEASRLYLVNCAICHGDKLDGNGPLYKDGNGPFPAAPKNFMAADMKTLPEGTMFHSVTYGKNMMGSYASQLSTRQRWMIIHYIKEKQGLSGANSATSDSTAKTTATTDTTAKK